MKSSQQQRPVSTLGFSESNLSPAEVPVEKMTASRSITALVNNDEANDKTDVYAKVLKQVYDTSVFVLYNFYDFSFIHVLK